MGPAGGKAEAGRCSVVSPTRGASILVGTSQALASVRCGKGGVNCVIGGETPAPWPPDDSTRVTVPE